MRCLRSYHFALDDMRLEEYDRAGLFHRIPVIAPDHDGRLARKLGAQFAGLTVSTRWSPDDDADESRSFVRSFRERYGRTPTASAMQGYDAAIMLAGAQAPEHPTVQWHAWEIFTNARGAAYLATREATIRLPAGAVPTCPATAAPPPTSRR